MAGRNALHHRGNRPAWRRQVDAARAPLADRQASEMGALRPYRDVLIVEDEATFRSIVARNLTSRGVRTREAGTAADAVRAAMDERPDLLLLDLNLPDRSGWDVLRELRQRGIEVPTVVVSAVHVSIERLQEFRPLAYLPKPFPLDSLLRLVLGADRHAEPRGAPSSARGTDA